MVKLNEQNRDQYTKTVLQAIQTNDKQKFREKFLELHPSDQADLFKLLKHDERERVYSFLQPQEFGVIFSLLEVKDQHNCMREMDESYASQMYNHMFTDDVVNFLKNVRVEEANAILKSMDTEKADKVKMLLAYTRKTAGAVMTKEFISISSTDTADSVIEQLRKEAIGAEIIYYNYVVDQDGQLVGVVSLRDLITAAPEKTIEQIMSTQIVSVPDDMDQEEVVQVIKKYDFLAAPVVSKQNRLLGIVTVDDVMDIWEDETTEDFGEISAVRNATDTNLNTLTAAKNRSPWIISLMILGLVTAGVIGYFEETLESVVLLAVFIPMIMDSAGNVGTQSLAVAVRGLALGTIEQGGFFRMVRRELGTGVLIGIGCMVTIFVLILVRYQNWLLALIVGVSLLFTLTISAVVGAVVPLIINKLKLDPAIASGPFITTVNDIIGLVIYFSIATALMDML